MRQREQETIPSSRKFFLSLLIKCYIYLTLVLGYCLVNKGKCYFYLPLMFDWRLCYGGLAILDRDIHETFVFYIQTDFGAKREQKIDHFGLSCTWC